ncbi:BTAD domain-containing putative transcriptional regulator [Streptomyces sp. NPDC059002]|uniref:AfsR/SARP family transcriptional regulator n=1 Tax=Streptomyces sp. NPDC059002 TaxID=3346690 RepID=UPI0036C89C1A
MEINILGSLNIEHDGERTVPASQRASFILSFLALTPGCPVSFDQIVDELWAGRSMANARNALQANIGRLRKILKDVTGMNGDLVVRTVGTGYLLDVSPEAVDANRFVNMADKGGVLCQRDPRAAVAQLEAALALWRGPALLDGSDGLRCRARAADLEERRVTAYEDLVAVKLAIDAERVPLAELRQLAAEHSERERLSELLMLALYRDGRQAEALEVFHGARRRLADDLGLEPGRALHSAYQAILTQDEGLGEPRRALLDLAFT